MSLIVWVFIFLGIIHIFILHGILLGGLKSNKADDQSRQIMKQHWKNYLLENLRLLLIGLLLIVFDLLLTGLLPSAEDRTVRTVSGGSQTNHSFTGSASGSFSTAGTASSVQNTAASPVGDVSWL